MRPYPSTEYVEERMRSRFIGILVKWIVIAIVLMGMWLSGLFKVLFILVLLLVQEANRFLVWLGEPTKMGAKAYWNEYGIYWLMFYAALTVITITLHYTVWRRARPHFVRGGMVEGRIVGIKGVRRGLRYDWWDFVNYVRVVLLKKKPTLRDRLRRNWDILTGRLQGEVVWPDPHGAPWGHSDSRNTIIWFTRPWRLKRRAVIIPRTVKHEDRFFSVRYPPGYFVNKPSRDRPGEVILVWLNDRPGFSTYDAEAPLSDLEGHLFTSRGLVMQSVGVNPEQGIRDFSLGSQPILGTPERLKPGGEKVE